MKLSINCHSLLLQKSLENFLKRYIVSKNRADFIISDRDIGSDKPVFIVGKDIEKPFSRSRLFIELERFEKNLDSLNAVKNIDSELDDSHLSFEQEVQKHTQEFVQLIIQTYKKHHEKTTR
ncbi:MAG: hypothetical protein ACQESH_01910 [Campylobacterota bacterium]